MLTHLSIHNFALIEKLALDFISGLIIFTGETGAGKSIIMDALSLTLGKRGEASFIREGCDKCEISAVFSLAHQADARSWLTNNELLTDDQDCILRRIITRDGRSKSFINDQPVSLQSLREFSLLLVNLHGQHEHQHLLQSEGQRQLLDTFGRLDTLRLEVKQHYQHYRDLKNQLEAKQAEYQQLLSQQDFLNFQANELSALTLKEGEVDALEKEQKRLAHGSQLLEGVQAVLFALDDDEQSVTALMRTHTNKLTHLADYDEKLNDIVKLLDSANIQVKEAVGELNYFVNKLDIDPARLTEVDERLSRIYELARKHHVAPSELVALEQSLADKVAFIANDSQVLRDIEEKLETSLQQYHLKAKELSQKRSAAAKKLNQLITQYMQKLGMKGGVFEAQVNMPIESLPTITGYDKIEFLVSTNPGTSLQALAKVASGGELSRLSLAISVVTTANNDKMTLIYDEIDSGIGGATAACVGELLKQLSQHHQILCITHAPQVATFSHQHFVVTKKAQKNKTQVSISELTTEEKVHEIARMIGGAQITQSSLAHAKEMLSSV